MDDKTVKVLYLKKLRLFVNLTVVAITLVNVRFSLRWRLSKLTNKERKKKTGAPENEGKFNES